MSFYYSWDTETRSIFTQYGLLDADQSNYPNGITRSWTVGCAWTSRLTKHLYSTVGAEYSEKTVISDSVLPDLGRQYLTGAEYINLPFGVQYNYGRKFRIGAFAGGAVKFNIERSDVFDNRVNADARLGFFLEYRFTKCWVKLMPLYRQDLFDTFKWFETKNAVSKGIQLELTF
jgi:hypothetical protein